MIKAVIYDFDGTIADTLQIHLHAYRYALEKLGVKISDKEIIEKCFNKHDNEISEHFHINTDKFSTLYSKEQEKGLKKAKPCKGAVEVLKALKKSDVKLAVGSMNWDNIVKGLVKNLELNKYFECVKGYKKSTKTKAETFSAICNELNVNYDEIIVVGDADSDIIGAKSIGARSVLYYPEENEKIYSFETLSKHKPDFVMKKHEEIFRIIEKISQ